jgi:hypothetical protein
MPFAWRRRHVKDGESEPERATCAHVWRTRDVSVALPEAVCTVCDRCGSVRIDDPADRATPTEDAASGDGPVLDQLSQLRSSRDQVGQGERATR